MVLTQRLLCADVFTRRSVVWPIRHFCGQSMRCVVRDRHGSVCRHREIVKVKENSRFLRIIARDAQAEETVKTYCHRNDYIRSQIYDNNKPPHDHILLLV
uniref:Uncharacterized protein n=1 Tax=Schizaphis graminum TaxID=13262 RepID=A0A2S2N7Y1_SCHGA